MAPIDGPGELDRRPGYEWRVDGDQVDLGSEHAYSKILDPAGVWVGIIEHHTNPAGQPCSGYCLFNVPEADAWAAAYVFGQPRRWEVSFDPLTMSPSIACKTCPSHGFIQQGRWVGA